MGSYKLFPVLTHKLGTILEAWPHKERGQKDQVSLHTLSACRSHEDCDIEPGYLSWVTFFPRVPTLHNTTCTTGSVLLGLTFPLLGHPGSQPWHYVNEALTGMCWLCAASQDDSVWPRKWIKPVFVPGSSFWLLLSVLSTSLGNPKQDIYSCVIDCCVPEKSICSNPNP